MIERKEYEQLLQSRLNEPRHFMQVIIGPRQVGKTTLVRMTLEKINIPYSIHTADTVKDEGWLSMIWQQERLEMQYNNQPERLLIIDEVQKVPNWSDFVKKEWDDDTWNNVNLKVLLLGSSRLLIMSGLSESLAGRYELIKMTHWTYSEMQEAFGWDLNTYIYYGGYPGAAHLIGQPSRWRAYVKTSIAEPSITKDVLETSNIYKPALLKQVFELGCSYSTKLLSYTKLIGQLQDAGNATTITAYMQLLSEANLVAGLQKYSKDEARKRQSIPKFQVFNNALLNAYSRSSFDKAVCDPVGWGKQVESAVGAYLLSQAELLDMQLWYWREKNEEVDFILEWDGEIVAIEVKSNGERMTTGLTTFKNAYHPKQSILVGPEGVSLETFLRLDLRKLFE